MMACGGHINDGEAEALLPSYYILSACLSARACCATPLEDRQKREGAQAS